MTKKKKNKKKLKKEKGKSAQNAQSQDTKDNELINFVKKGIQVMKMFFNCSYKLIYIENKFHIKIWINFFANVFGLA